MKKAVIFGIVTVLLMLTVLGCSQTASTTSTVPKSSAAPAQKTSSTPTPQYGGILKLIASAGITNLGYPGKSSSPTDFPSARPAVESLLTFDPKGTGDPYPLLATAWQTSPDYKSITFTLRQGVKFHDGTDFDAEAAKFNLDLSRLGVRAKTSLSPIDSIDVVDKYTIRLNLSRYEPQLWSTFCGYPTQMVSPTAIKTLGDECLTHPVGTGPFKFVSYQRDASLKFQKFDGYWQKGKPYLDGIEWIIIADPVTALASLKAGEAQVSTVVSPKDASDLQKTGKYSVAGTPVAVFGVIGDSAHADSPFANIKVRQAIAYAINNEAIAKNLGFGLYKPANQFAAPGGYGYNPAVTGYPYNPQKAKELLTSAGYPTGFKTTITYRSGTTNEDLFTAVQGYLSAFGIEVKLDPADQARYLKVQTGGWSNQLVAADIPGSVGMDPGQGLGDNFSSKATRIDVKSFYIPPAYDEKLSAAKVEFDGKKRVAMFQEIQKMMIDEFCMAIPIYVGYSSSVIDSSTVQDLDLYQYSQPQWCPEKAWLKK